MAQQTPVRIEVYVGTQWTGAESTDVVEYDRDEWNAKTPEERKKLLDEIAEEALADACYASARVLDEV